eukprot:192721-Chlamydomonas_euryale.AAC.7
MCNPGNSAAHPTPSPWCACPVFLIRSTADVTGTAPPRKRRTVWHSVVQCTDCQARQAAWHAGGAPMQTAVCAAASHKCGSIPYMW